MALTNAWHSRIKLELPMCPGPTIRNAVVDTLIEICERAGAWKEGLDAISVVADTASYSLALPGDYAYEADIHAVFRVELDSSPLSSASEEVMDRRSGTAWREEESSSPTHYIVGQTDAILLYPIPTEDYADGLLVYVLLKPQRTATEVPDFFYVNHYDTVLHGAIARLAAQKGTPWYTPDIVQLHAGKYSRNLGETVSATWRGRAPVGLKVRMPKLV